MINIAKKLENAQIGTKLYSMVYGEVQLTKIDKYENECDICYSWNDNDGDKLSDFVDEYGRFPKCNGECTLFPSKDQRDWSKFKIDLPIDTPCIVSDKIRVKDRITIRYYAGNGKVFVDGKKSKDDSHTVAFSHIIPVDKFNFENLSFAVTDDYGYNK